MRVFLNLFYKPKIYTWRTLYCYIGYYLIEHIYILFYAERELIANSILNQLDLDLENSHWVSDGTVNDILCIDF